MFTDDHASGSCDGITVNGQNIAQTEKIILQIDKILLEWNIFFPNELKHLPQY